MRRVIALALLAGCSGLGHTDGNCGGAAAPLGSYRCASNQVEVCIESGTPGKGALMWQVIEDCTIPVGTLPGACVLQSSGQATCVR